MGGLTSPEAAQGLMKGAVARQQLLHAELELHSAMTLPLEQEGEETQPDGTNIVYTHSDGTVKYTKLTSLQCRAERMEKAITTASQEDCGADIELVDTAKTYANEVNEVL